MAEAAGFCYGVRRAVNATQDEARRGPNQVYTLGPIIHNPQVVEALATQGVLPVDDLSDIPGGTVILRTHGVTPGIAEEASRRGFKVVDVTCPYVRHSQRTAVRMREDGRQVIIVGEENHPEVRGIVGWLAGEADVIRHPTEAETLIIRAPLGVVAQTTMDEETYTDIIAILRGRTRDLLAEMTICSATKERQGAALALTERVDVILVVGGRQSANTRRLRELCSANGREAYLIETAAEIQTDWFRPHHRVGITAGASTPDWIIKEVVDRMDEIKEETLAAEASTADAMVAQPEEREEVDYEQGLREFHAGEVVKGRVVQINDDGVLVDVGYKSEGFIPLNELSYRRPERASDVLQVGQEVEAVILGLDSAEDGGLRLSKKRADEHQAWDHLQGLFDRGEILEVKVIEAVKGGLVADVGARGFIPASQVDRGYQGDLADLVGQTVKVKVIELDPGKHRVILSRKAVLEEDRRLKRDEIWGTIAEGQILDGTVKSLTDFGVFIDLGGVDGLLHVSEISWARINHPSEALQEGQKLQVKVLRLDREKGRISLGLKQVLPNPWEALEAKYPVDSVHRGRVVRLATFGAFVELEPGVDGLVHISQMADHHIAKPSEVVEVGDEVMVRVLRVSPEERRVSLSLREAVEPTELPPENSGDLTLGDLAGNLREDFEGQHNE